jgi:lysyl-tRNA synthetase class 2
MVSADKNDCDFLFAESKDKILEILRQHNIPVAAPHTPSRLVDKLISHFIEPKCIAPTFLYGHPIIMSPLAREREAEEGEANPSVGFADRFELMILGQELVNAYSELSDPDEQRRRFEMQARERAEVTQLIICFISKETEREREKETGKERVKEDR